jgi:hypothetical protein
VEVRILKEMVDQRSGPADGHVGQGGWNLAALPEFDFVGRSSTDPKSRATGRDAPYRRDHSSRYVVPAVDEGESVNMDLLGPPNPRRLGSRISGTILVKNKGALFVRFR